MIVLSVLSFIGRALYGIFAFVLIVILTIIEAVLKLLLAIGTALAMRICCLCAILVTLGLIVNLLDGKLKFNSKDNWDDILIGYGIVAGVFVVVLLANIIVETIGSLIDKLRGILQRN